MLFPGIRHIFAKRGGCKGLPPLDWEHGGCAPDFSFSTPPQAAVQKHDGHPALSFPLVSGMSSLLYCKSRQQEQG